MEYIIYLDSMLKICKHMVKTIQLKIKKHENERHDLFYPLPFSLNPGEGRVAQRRLSRDPQTGSQIKDLGRFGTGLAHHRFLNLGRFNPDMLTGCQRFYRDRFWIVNKSAEKLMILG